MILGRPVNLWLGFATAVVGFGSTIAVVVLKIDPIVVATVAGSTTGLLGAGIGLLSGQPPTLAPGDTYHVSTPTGQPDIERVVTPTRAVRRATDGE